MDEDRFLPALGPAPSGRAYAPSHVWARSPSTAEESGRLGIDVFLASILPPLREVIVPTPRTRLAAGAPFAWLAVGEIVLPLPSPVAAESVELNPLLRENPNLVRTAPYAEGYIVGWRRPAGGGAWVRTGTAAKAASTWILDLETVRRTVRAATAKTAATMQDGGAPVACLFDLLGPEAFARLFGEIVWRR